MPKKDHIWTFKSSALVTGLDAPLSLEYHVPASQLKVPPRELVGSRTWLVMRRNGESFLYALVVPSSLETYMEGRYKGDFVMKSNPFYSIRVLPRHESAAPWSLPESFDSREGIRECEDSERDQFENLLKTNARSGFASPSKSVLTSIPQTRFSELGLAVPDQLSSTLRTVSFGDISRSQDFAPSLSVFGGIALAALALAQPQIDKDAAIDLMASLDPLSPTRSDGIKGVREVTRATSAIPPMVDIFLEEIDPEKISPRSFVARGAKATSDWLEKTNRAEEAHEKILKDVVLRLKERGFKTMKSRSFDLVAEKAGKKTLFEVKSSNEHNAVAQAEKGILQILRYSTAIPEDFFSNTRMCILLEDPGIGAIVPHLSKMVARIGAELWLYDDSQEWPQRISNLRDETLPGV